MARALRALVARPGASSQEKTGPTPLWTEYGMKKLLGGVVIAFALFYLLTQPHSAAEVVKGAGAVVGDAFNATITFINALFH